MRGQSVILFLAVLAVCQASDTFNNALSDTNTCNTNCSEIFKESELVDECDRGCRFHVIGEFVSSDLNASQVNLACYGACVEAYGENSSRADACKKGCDVQQKFVADSKKKETDEGPSIHLLSPLMQVHAVYSSFVGAVHIIRSSLVTYFISDDNTIVAVESEPEIVLGIDPDALDAENPLLKAQQQDSRQLSVSDDSEEPSIVKCVSRQIGVPPYILVVSVLALIVFTMYVIIALCSTNNKKGKAYTSAKNMHIEAMPLPVKLVRPEDLTKLSLTEEDDLQAPALPIKIKLPNTMI